jgi:H/ACA ribonucleoprotein complex non-core subunit NAF1
LSFLSFFYNNINYFAVVVQAMKNTPALDLDSVLFLDKGRNTLGKIFDVIGPVCEPAYCVRFNSTQQIQEKGIEKGLVVYCAPKTDHTSYVFLGELLKYVLQIF